MKIKLTNKQRQVIAEKISSTERVLELLGLEYAVTGPKIIRSKGNKSPRIVHVDVGEKSKLWIGNSATGSTWGNEPNGKPMSGVHSIEDLYVYLKERIAKSKKKPIKKTQ